MKKIFWLTFFLLWLWPALVFAQTATVMLSWQDNSANEDGFQIERREGQGAYGLIASTGANITGYADIVPLTLGHTYCYRVFAFNAAGRSTPSNEACMAVPLPQKPPPPATVTAQAVSTTQIRVAWTAVLEAEGYVVERKQGANGIYQAISQPTAPILDDPGLTAGTLYCYRVQSVKTKVLSDYSPESCATTPIEVIIPKGATGLTIEVKIE